MLRRDEGGDLRAHPRSRDGDLSDRRRVGTLITGGSLTEAKPTDLTRVNAGMSQTGVHQGGESRRVKKDDVIIVPAGTAHRFSELDGPITYLVYRFEPKR